MITKRSLRIGMLCFLASIFISAILRAQTDSKGGESNSAPSVLVGGSGSNPQDYETVVDFITDSLKQRGVALKQLDPGKSRDSYFEQLKSSEAGSLLYVIVDNRVGALKAKVTVDCFDREGKRLWQEETGSSFGASPKKLANAMAKKLEAHLGKDGLPSGKK